RHRYVTCKWRIRADSINRGPSSPGPLHEGRSMLQAVSRSAMLQMLAEIGGRLAESRRGGMRMFIAMNRFRVLKESTRDFENVWFSRDSYLHELPGFIAFHLLRGPEREDHVLYSSHTMWRSYADFEAWTKSEAFRKAHARAGDQKRTTLGHPEFEGFH